MEGLGLRAFLPQAPHSQRGAGAISPSKATLDAPPAEPKARRGSGASAPEYWWRIARRFGS